MKQKIILVYFDVDKWEIGKANNMVIRKEIEDRIKKYKKRGQMTLGDFNGHSELLEPERKEYENRKMSEEWIEEFN